MELRSSPIATRVGAALLALLIGCGGGQGGGPPQAGGGSPATGGMLADGGRGGSTGSGGSSASGGTTATGGSAAGGSNTSSTGGTSATGGRSGTGGTVATGGTASTGGRTGSDAGTGGSATDGSATGGSAIGGSATGGSATGGSTARGGSGGAGGVSGAGGAGTGGSGSDASVDGRRVTEAGPETKPDVAAGGDAAAYQPCPSNGDPCKILPLGDSITFGVGDEGNGGYRGPLFALAVAAQQKTTFTGSLSNGPGTVSGQTFPKKNEGHSGWGISQVTPYSGGNAGISTVIPTPAFSSGSGGVPHIILLHIGTNDQGSLSATQMTSDLAGLLDKLIGNAPDALLVVAQIIPLGYGTNDAIKTYNKAIPGLVQERAAAGKHITMVDMYTGFAPTTMLASDNIHPNATGYELMADRWYAAIGSLLPK